MRTLLKFLLGLLAVLFLLGVAGMIAARMIPLHIHDSFESPALSWRWNRWRFEQGAVRPEREIVRSGQQSLAITVHSGDRYEEARDDGAATERAEIMEQWWLWSRTGRTYVYSFSLFLPKDLPDSAERLVVAQWRQLCEARRCRPENPILAVRYQQGMLEITRQDERERYVLYRSGEDIRGRWLDFRFVIKFDPKQGRIEATLNGTNIVTYRGSTLFSLAHGYPANGLVYFKTGLYRDAKGERPWTLYVDEYRKDESAKRGCS
jgi:hypothetical protein